MLLLCRSSWLTQIVFRYHIIFESIVMAYNIDIEFDLGVFMRLKLIFVIFLYLNGYNNSNPFTKEIFVPDMSREVKYGNELKNSVSICERLTWSQFDNSISIIVFVRFSNVEFFSS